MGRYGTDRHHNLRLWRSSQRPKVGVDKYYNYECISAEEFSTGEKISVLFAVVKGGIARTVIDDSASPEPMDKNTRERQERLAVVAIKMHAKPCEPCARTSGGGAYADVWRLLCLIPGVFVFQP